MVVESSNFKCRATRDPPPDSPERGGDGCLRFPGSGVAAKALSEIHDHLRTEMHRAQLCYQQTADTHRLPALDYQVGDLVWLDARNWKTRRPSAKLDHRRHGPFKIARKISSHAFRLELHSSMQVHPVFHVSLLEPAAQDPLLGHQQPPPPPVEIDGEQEWFVDSMLDSRMYRR